MSEAGTGRGALRFVRLRRTVIVAMSLLFLLYMWLRSMSDSVPALAFSQITFLVAPVLSSTFTIAAASSTMRNARERRLWMVMSVASLLLLFVEIMGALVILSVVQSGTQVETLFLLFGAVSSSLLVVASAVDVSVGALPPWRRTRLAVDTIGFLVITGGSALVFWSILLTGGRFDPSATVIEQAVYWTVGLVVIVCAVVIRWSAGLHARELWRSTFFVALLAFGGSMIIHPIYDFMRELGVPSFNHDVLSTMLVFVGYAATFISAWTWLNTPDARSYDYAGLDERSSSARPTVLGTVYFIAMTLAMAFMVLDSSVEARIVDLAVAVSFSAAFCIAVSLWMREAETEWLSRMSLTDAASGAFNRAALDRDIRQQLEYLQDEGGLLLVVSIDPDGFSRFNALHGYRYGDGLLNKVHEALADAASGRANVYRPGGDSFVLLADVDDRRDAVALVRSFSEAVSAVPVREGELTASIGWVLGAPSVHDPVKLLTGADDARGWAKQFGGGVALEYAEDGVREQASSKGVTFSPDESVSDVVKTLATTADLMDSRHHDHSRRVAVLAGMMAAEMDFSPDHIHRVQIAALLHDVGIIALPSIRRDDVTARVGDDSEETLSHAVYGARMAEAVGVAGISAWIRAHHEKWDGSGYPDGLRGSEIPVEAQIIALADGYDELTSPRSRGALSKSAALQEMDLRIGGYYDPELAEPFIALIGRSISQGWSNEAGYDD